MSGTRWLPVILISAALSGSNTHVECFIPTVLRGKGSLSSPWRCIPPLSQQRATGSCRPKVAGTFRRGASMPIRAAVQQDDDDQLRKQFDDLLEKSGRDSGMKKLKAPKGSWASMSGGKKEEAKKDLVTKGESSREESVEETTKMQAKPSIPSYAQMDAYLKGKKTEPLEEHKDAEAAKTPNLVRPSYSISKSASNTDSTNVVSVKSFEEGDDVPLDLFQQLVDNEDKPIDLSELESMGKKLLLIVPEPSRHSGSASDNWTKLLIDIQNKLGSRLPAVSCIAVSPEPSGLHVKMLNKFKLKLFSFVSDPDRRLMHALKLWDPKAAGTGVTMERQTFIIDVSSKRFVKILRQEPFLGHADIVRDSLIALSGMQEDDTSTGTEVLSGPPLRAFGAKEEGGAMESTQTDPVSSSSIEEVQLEQIMDKPQRMGESLIVQVVIDVDEDLVGVIIGKKGATIRQLQEDTGAKIKIETTPMCRALIRGTREQCKLAIEQIEEMTLNLQMISLDVPQSFAKSRVNFKKLAEVREQLNADIRLEKGEQNENLRWIVRGRDLDEEEVNVLLNSVLESSMPQDVFVYEHGNDQLLVRSLLGMKGSFIKQLEEEAGLTLRFRNDGKTISFTAFGSPEVIEQLRSRFKERMASMVEEILPLQDEEINTLLANGGKNVRKVEEGCEALVSIEREPSMQMRVRGEKEEVKKAIDTARMVLGMQESDMLLIPNNLCRMLVGPRRANLNWLEEEAGCFFNVKNQGNEIYLQISGNEEQRAAGANMVKELLYSNSSKYTATKKLSSDLVAELLRRKGMKMREIETSTGTYISAIKLQDEDGVEDQEGNFSGILLRGTPDAINRAFAMIEERLEQSVDELLLDEILGKEASVFELRALIGFKGQKIAEIEQQTGAIVRIDQGERPRLRISGSQVEKDKVVKLIREWLSGSKTEFMPLDKSMHGSLIGVRGRVVRWMEERSGARISFQTDKETAEIGMLVCGSEQQCSAAIELARDILENEKFEHFFLPASSFGAILGPKGKYVKEIEMMSGARVHVLDDYNSMEMSRFGVNVQEILSQKSKEDMAIIVKGSNEQRRLARDLISDFLEASGVDVHTFSHEDFDSISSVRGSFIVMLEEECSVMAKLNFKNSTIEIKGKEKDRRAAFEKIRHYLALEEQEILFEAEFPVIMLRSFIGLNGKNVKEVEKRTGCWIRVVSESRFHLILKGDAEARGRVVKEVDEWKRNNQHERFPMEESKHYAIIGKQGATIHKIEQESNTVICFSTTPEPAMIVFGKEEDRKVAFALAQQVAQGNSREQDVMTIPRELHALIIGMNGKSIKKVEQDSGARVQIKGIDVDNCIITGTDVQRSAAMRMLQDMVRGHGTSKVPCEERLHRVIIGPRGSTVTWIEKRSSTVISFMGGSQPCVVIKGAEDDRAQAVSLVEEILKEEIEEKFYVEQRYHGYLIGPGGSRIREIEDTTGTRIDISDEEPVIVITGLRVCRDEAWELIQAKMDEMDAAQQE